MRRLSVSELPVITRSAGRFLLKPYLSLPVHPDDARRGLVRRRDEDGLAADAVHVDAGARLQVVQVDVAILGDEENHILLGAYLEKPGRERRDQIAVSAGTTTNHVTSYTDWWDNKNKNKTHTFIIVPSFNL